MKKAFVQNTNYVRFMEAVKACLLYTSRCV